jgi:LDH2 family malate/lactate/ureidoglycolate dehydrogenase
MPENTPKKGQLTFNSTQLHHFTRQIFLHNGLSAQHAQTASYALVRANLRGVDSHGVARLPMYCERLRLGVANPLPKIEVSRVAPAVALLDGDNGLGLIVGKKGMATAIDIAREFGIGLVGVKRSGHYGMAALYILQAIEADCVGLAFTNASPALPVWGGRNKFLGTNPFAAGAPTGGMPAFILDMACSIIARGKLKFAAQRGESIPEGLALDKNGCPTTDGHQAFEGVVLPFGGVKGAGLSMLMDVLSGVLTGAAFGGEARNPFTGLEGPQGTGHFFIALKADLFMSLAAFTQRMQTLVQRVKTQPLAEGFDEIQIPGEPEHRMEIARLENGIPLSPDVIEALKSEADLAGVSFPAL